MPLHHAPLNAFLAINTPGSFPDVLHDLVSRLIGIHPGDGVLVRNAAILMPGQLLLFPFDAPATSGAYQAALCFFETLNYRETYSA